MESAKKAALQSLTHEMRAQIKPTYKMSEVYEKLNTISPYKSGVIQNLYNWKFISKYFSTKWDKFLNMPMSLDDKLRLSVKLENVDSVTYGIDGIDRLELVRDYQKQYIFKHHVEDNWDGEMYIEDFSIKNDVDVAVMWILNKSGITFYWEDGSWEMLEEDYLNEPNEDFVFNLQLYNKYNNIAEEWKHKLKTYKKGIKPILQHLKKKSLSNVDRLWYSFLLYLNDFPEIYHFQTPEEGALFLNNKYKVIPKNNEYAEQMRPFRDEWGYCAGFTYYITIMDSQIWEDTLQYHEDCIHDVYDFVFNKNYWFNNYSTKPYYADKIKSFISSNARYNRLLQCSGQSDLHGTIESVQGKILRFFNIIKKRNQINAAKTF